MQIALRSSRRLRAVVVFLMAAGVGACDATTDPSDSLTAEQMQSVAISLENVANQSIFIDLFGSSVLPSVNSTASARQVSVATREMIGAAARSMSAYGEVAAAEAFPTSIKGKTFVPTSTGGWVWDPAEPSPGAQVVRFVVRNSLGQTRGWLNLTDLLATGATMRYRAELITTANLKVMDYTNTYVETLAGSEVSSYTYDANGQITDGQTAIAFNYHIVESGLTTASPTGSETYSVDVPRLQVTFDLTGQGSGGNWTNDYTMTVRNGEVRWLVAADNTVRMYRGTEHIANGLRNQTGSTSWRSPSNASLGPVTEGFVLAADRAGEAMFAPVTATILVDWLAVSVQP